MNSGSTSTNLNALPIRVFISYSRNNESLVTAIEKILEQNGLSPIRDRHFAIGLGFQDQIRRFIEHAHVFMPIVTEQSNLRGWVQQEIGYAVAQNIPVLPIAVGTNPGEWIQSLQAIKLDLPERKLKPSGRKKSGDDQEQFDLSQLKKVLTRRRVELLVRTRRDEKFATYVCARLQEDRARMLTEYCDGVETIQMALETDSVQNLTNGSEHESGETPHNSFVRQSGALSSFHIPDKPINDAVWTDRYGGVHKGDNHCRLQREERRALERHATAHGCRLIIDPSIKFSDDVKKSRQIREARIASLLEFLEETEAGLITQIVPEPSKAASGKNDMVPKTENITIVGNWFFAIAITAKKGRGYNQTIFTRHAPSMHLHIEQFDEQFFSHLDAQGWTLENCRANTIKKLKAELRRLRK